MFFLAFNSQRRLLAEWPGEAVALQSQSAEDDNPTMNNNSEPERDPAVETDYSAEEAEQMGAFVEDALSFKDARQSVHDMGYTIVFGATGAGKSKSLAELLKDAVARSEKPEQ
jgi:hypothetical protein